MTTSSTSPRVPGSPEASSGPRQLYAVREKPRAVCWLSGSSAHRAALSQVCSLPGLDLLPLCVTFLLCFWEVQYGILAGTLVSVLILLHSVARPSVQVPAHPDPRGDSLASGPEDEEGAGKDPQLCVLSFQCDCGLWPAE